MTPGINFAAGEYLTQLTIERHAAVCRFPGLCAGLVRADSLMRVRGFPLRIRVAQLKTPKTLEEWYRTRNFEGGPK
jgi:hypothetical protein